MHHILFHRSNVWKQCLPPLYVINKLVSIAVSFFLLISNIFFSFWSFLPFTMSPYSQIYYCYYHGCSIRYQTSYQHSFVEQTSFALVPKPSTQKPPHLCVIHFRVFTMLRTENTKTLTICAAWGVVIVTEHVISLNTCLVYWAERWLTFILKKKKNRNSW